VTGLMIAGAAYFWQEILAFFADLTANSATRQ
jgi:hypothetical protein